jgi:hypothetical protein
VLLILKSPFTTSKEERARCYSFILPDTTRDMLLTCDMIRVMILLNQITFQYVMEESVGKTNTTLSKSLGNKNPVDFNHTVTT